MKMRVGLLFLLERSFSFHPTRTRARGDDDDFLILFSNSSSFNIHYHNLESLFLVMGRKLVELEEEISRSSMQIQT